MTRESRGRRTGQGTGADLTDERIASWTTGRPSNPLTADGVYMALEIQRHRAARAADKERIHEIVRCVARHEMSSLHRQDGRLDFRSALLDAVERDATIGAIAGRAAHEIDCYLRGIDLEAQPHDTSTELAPGDETLQTVTPQLVTVGDRCRHARKEEGLTLGDAARELGVAVVTLSDVELGRTPPIPPMLDWMADLYGVTADWLRSEPRPTDATVDLGESHDDTMPVITIDSDQDGVAVQVDMGLISQEYVPLPMYHPDEAEEIATDLLLGADAARQAQHDGHAGPAVVVELIVGDEPADDVDDQDTDDPSRREATGRPTAQITMQKIEIDVVNELIRAIEIVHGTEDALRWRRIVDIARSAMAGRAAARGHGT